MILVYIEKEIEMEFTTDQLIDDFDAIQTRRVAFKWNKLVLLTSRFYASKLYTSIYMNAFS